MTGRGNSAFTTAAHSFLRRWPAVQAWAQEPLRVQLAANTATHPFITLRFPPKCGGIDNED